VLCLLACFRDTPAVYLFQLLHHSRVSRTRPLLAQGCLASRTLFFCPAVLSLFFYHIGAAAVTSHDTDIASSAVVGQIFPFGSFSMFDISPQRRIDSVSFHCYRVHV
jgi:hypothetical protein